MLLEKKRINYFKTDGLITFNWTLKVLSFRAFAPAFVTVFFSFCETYFILSILCYTCMLCIGKFTDGCKGRTFMI